MIAPDIQSQFCSKRFVRTYFLVDSVANLQKLKWKSGKFHNWKVNMFYLSREGMIITET